MDYTVTLLDGSPLPSVLNFTESNRTFQIYTATETASGTYDIKVVGRLINWTVQNHTYFTWRLNVQSNAVAVIDKYVIKNSPPYFKTPLIEVNIYAGNTTYYTLPEILEAEGDKWKAALYPQGFSKLFSKLSGTQLVFNPELSMNGTYYFTVQLSDGTSARNYSIQLNVLPSEQLNQTALDNCPVCDDRFIINNITLREKQLKKSLSAYIQSIDINGYVTIVFSEDMLIPDNFPLMRLKDVLKFVVAPPDDSIFNLTQSNFTIAY